MIIDRCSIMGKEEGIFIDKYEGVCEALEKSKNRLTWPGENGEIPEHVGFIGEYDWDYFNKTK